MNTSYLVVTIILVLALFISFTSQEDSSITGYQIQPPPPGSDQLACPSSMLSYWTLEEGTGNWFADFRDVHDLYFFTSRGNDAWWIQGLVGYAVNVYANGEWFGHNSPDSSYSFGEGDSFTIEFLFRTSARPPGVVPQNILNKKDYDQASNVWRGYTISYLDSGKLSFNLYDDGTGASLVTQKMFADGLWHHVVAVRKAGQELLWFVDGVLDASGPDTSRNTYIPTQKVVFFGGPTRQWIGDIDEIAIYNEALTPEAIQAHSAKTQQNQHYCSICPSQGSTCGDGCVTGNEQCEQDNQCSTGQECISCACITCDQDKDTYKGPQCGGNDCSDKNPNINPGASEICNDLLDNDCDTLIDCNDNDCSTSSFCQQPPPKISYYDRTNGDLKYAALIGNQWSISIVDPGLLINTNGTPFSEDVGRHTSIALDSNKNPHIIYFSATYSDMKHAKYVGTGGNCGYDNAGNFVGDWQCSIIEKVNSLPYYAISLELDSMNLPKASYLLTSSTVYKIQYAKYLPFGGGNCGYDNAGNFVGDWQCNFIDSSTRGVMSISIHTDTTDTPSVIYARFTDYSRMLGYAYYQPSGNCGENNDWQCESIVTSKSVGYSDSVIDNTNTPQIVYVEASSLNYAKNTGAGNCGSNADWQCDLIQNVPVTPSSPPSVSIDSSSNIHFSYDSNPSLRYAHYVGSGGNCGPQNDWQCDIIETPSSGQIYQASLDVSPIINTPHISYYHHSIDTSFRDLKYAHYVGSGGNCGPQNDWQCDTIDSTGWIGEFSSIVLG